MKTDIAVGDRLSNGAVVLAIRELNGSWLVLAWYERNGGSYVTWKLDITNHAYGGHYFDVRFGETVEALELAVTDFKRRM